MSTELTIDEKLKRRNAILGMEDHLLTQPQVELPLTHDFVDGVYARTMFIPKGTILTGAVHSKDCLSVIRTGELLIATENGSVHVKTGDMLPSKAGTKRAGIALEDTYITGFMANPTNETDLDVIWEIYTLPNEALPKLEKTEQGELLCSEYQQQQ
jgi:hypothetical protein